MRILICWNFNIIFYLFISFVTFSRSLFSLINSMLIWLCCSTSNCSAFLDWASSCLAVVSSLFISSSCFLNLILSFSTCSATVNIQTAHIVLAIWAIYATHISSIARPLSTVSYFQMPTPIETKTHQLHNKCYYQPAQINYLGINRLFQLKLQTDDA